MVFRQDFVKRHGFRLATQRGYRQLPHFGIVNVNWLWAPHEGGFRLKLTKIPYR